jgi:hypothetical protein
VISTRTKRYLSTSLCIYLHAECDFDTYECDYDTYKCDYGTHDCEVFNIEGVVNRSDIKAANFTLIRNERKRLLKKKFEVYIVMKSFVLIFLKTFILLMLYVIQCCKRVVN